MTDTPLHIWLLLHEGDDSSHVWADTPDPIGTGEIESVGYIKASVVDHLRSVLENYACPGRGICPTPWDGRGCSLGDGCGMGAADALADNLATVSANPPRHIGKLTRADRIDGGAHAIEPRLREMVVEGLDGLPSVRKLALNLSAAVLLGADEATAKFPSTRAITERLRGVYVVPVNDGLGLLDGKDTFTRSFETPPIQQEAARIIDLMASALAQIAEGGTPAKELAQKTLDWVNSK